jgi:hypothetical protein
MTIRTGFHFLSSVIIAFYMSGSIMWYINGSIVHLQPEICFYVLSLSFLTVFKIFFITLIQYLHQNTDQPKL